MLHTLIDYAVPACIVMLMLVSGTEISTGDFRRIARTPRTVLIGSAGQLLTLPLIALAIQFAMSPSAIIGASLFILALCPGGGISNFYTYLARCNVLLSATITAASTVLSLLTIPLWLALFPAQYGTHNELAGVPIGDVLLQLLVLMLIPMTAGALLRYGCPAYLERNAKLLRTASYILVASVLMIFIWSVGDNISGLLPEIASSAIAFITIAMLLGWLLGTGLSDIDRPVLTIECGVRNVGVALLLARSMLPQDDYGIFASFVTGYFILEISIMLTYAHLLSARSRYGRHTAGVEPNRP